MAKAPHALDVKLTDGSTRPYHAHPFDQGRKKRFGSWVYGKYREIAKLERDEEGQSEEEYQATLDHLRGLYFKGEFGFLSERGGAAACTPDGSVELVRLIFDLETTDDALELLALAGDQADELVGIVLKDSFPQSTNGKKVDEETKKKRLEAMASGYIPVRPVRPSPTTKTPETPSSSITST